MSTAASQRITLTQMRERAAGRRTYTDEYYADTEPIVHERATFHINKSTPGYTLIASWWDPCTGDDPQHGQCGREHPYSDRYQFATLREIEAFLSRQDVLA